MDKVTCQYCSFGGCWLAAFGTLQILATQVARDCGLIVDVLRQALRITFVLILI
jgi:hypothetical protein